MKNKRYALISVYDKKKLNIICKTLDKFNINFISTGSTAKEIIKKGFECQLISNLTKFREILDGRVKTLHPKIFASILYDREIKKHVDTFNDLNFPKIDFVIVNMYPFEKIIKVSNIKSKIIDMIDIGGPSLLRAAAKNYQSLTTICNTNDYDKLKKNLIKNKGYTSLDFRKKMAQKIFKTVSTYDENIYNWLSKSNLKEKKIILKYGENPNQKAKFIPNKGKASVFTEQIQGKQIGFNNILDTESGLNCINEFKEPTCVIIKHNNPCGISSSKSINIAFKKAYESDSESSFGGIVILNRAVNEKLATLLIKNFFEVVAAKSFDKKALKILSVKKKLILIKTKNILIKNQIEIKSAIGGNLIQEKNFIKIKKNEIKCVANKMNQNLEDIIFALKVCKHVKSNAIVLVKNKQTVGIGAGQMSRSDATKIAIMKLKQKNNIEKFVAASDAFFPFTDNIKRLKKAGCQTIIQPYGSKNDYKIINYAIKSNIGLYFTKYRFFKH